MSESLPPKMPVINDWLHHATTMLVGAGISSAKLDAEIILAHTIKQSRTFLHAHGDKPLEQRERDIADARLQLRLDRTPIAYIIGHKEFYGRKFRTTPATLIPRPESEDIISLLKESISKKQNHLHHPPRLIDIGTGTGCLGITAKLEIPELDVTLSDISRHALTIATLNAKKLQAEVSIIHSNLLDEYPFTPDYIIANLPYVDPSWKCSPETNFEPELALFASENGLHLIYLLIAQASNRLKSNGLLLLEADPRQHKAIIKHAEVSGFRLEQVRHFILSFKKR